MTAKTTTRELYEKLASSPERRKKIAETLFRQLRNADSGRNFSPDGATRYTGTLRTRTAD